MQAFPRFTPAPRRLLGALALSAAAWTTGCVAPSSVHSSNGPEAAINASRADRFGASISPNPAKVAPRTLAVALKVNANGHSLQSSSIEQANAMLTSQGPIGQQRLVIAPLSEQGAKLAPQLAQALVRSGAQTPQITALPTDAELLAQAQEGGWDVDLQSQAMVVSVDRCQIAKPDEWTIHPYYGVGTLGCANRANLARMTADPRDIVRPQTLDGASAAVAAAAVHRYQRGEIRELIDINFDE